MKKNNLHTSVFKASRKDYILHLLFYYFLNVMSLFLLLPYTYVLKKKYVLNNTYIDGKFLDFKGKISTAYKKFSLYFLLCIITLGIFYFFLKGKLMKWEVENTCYANSILPRKSYFDYSYKDYAIVAVNSFIYSLITLGFGVPHAMILKSKTKYNHMILEGESMKFIATNRQAFENYFKTYFLIIFSLGLYKLFRDYDMEKLIRESIVIKDDDVNLKQDDSSYLEKVCNWCFKNKTLAIFLYCFIILGLALLIVGILTILLL